METTETQATAAQRTARSPVMWKVASVTSEKETVTVVFPSAEQSEIQAEQSTQNTES